MWSCLSNNFFEGQAVDEFDCRTKTGSVLLPGSLMRSSVWQHSHAMRPQNRITASRVFEY